MEVMSLQDITPDQVVLWEWRFVKLNATLLYTWLVMAVLVISSWLATHALSVETRFARWQSFLEVVVSYMRRQIGDICQQDPDMFLPFIGTIFLFIALANLLGIVPGYVPPTASLSTAVAIAICVFVAVPLYGILNAGPAAYFRSYVRPTPFMLPFHIIGELSRTLALAVRLFGNVMSGTKIAAILLAVSPLILPVVMHALGLLTGLIQAYIFAVLAMVYIASASQAHVERDKERPKTTTKGANSNG